jgi:PAS domain S-box-containing protein
MFRWSLSVRTQLILLLGALVVLAATSLGPLAYNSSRAILEGSAVREAGITANARKQALLRLLSDQSKRAVAVVKTASLGCAPDETPCVQRVLADFVATGGATAVRLVYRRYRPIGVGEGSASLADVQGPGPGQIARFQFDEDGRPFYVITARSGSRDGQLSLTLRGDMQQVEEIFTDRYGLGQSGETFLIDSSGKFLITPRGEPAQASIQSCLSGSDAELVGRNDRGASVIDVFRYIPEISGCVVAQIDQAEAFAPTNLLRRRVMGVSALLAALAIAGSMLFAQLVSRPMYKLRDRARSLQKGDFDSPFPVRGPAEVRMFAETFEAMARSLQKSTEQISNILESIREGFCAFDREWRCTYVNDRALTLARVPRKRLLGRSLWDFLPADVSPEARDALRRAMQDRTPVQFEEFYAPVDTWFEINAYPTRDGLAVFGRDVTERKRFNERIQQTQKLESLGVLAGGIAHDFNNLLTGIIGNASLALEDLAGVHPTRRYLEDVVTAAQRAGALTGQLLAYAGKGRFVIQALNLSDVVREISGLIQASIPRGVKLRLHLEMQLPAIEGDAAQLQQLVMNLVINGAEAIAEGKTGTVVVTTKVQEVDDAYIQQTFGTGEISPGKYVGLEVADTGCGMDEATIARIFDPFFTTKFAGRGLGLAAAMGIVRGHKGAMKVYSTPGEGSSFKVLFPATADPAAARETRRADQDLTGTGTILVIDDEEIVRQTAKSALERFGYSVVTAEGGKEGLEVFSKLGDEVALVLLDMTMPQMAGEEVLRQLRALRPAVAVVLSSGYNEVEATRRFTGQGLAGFIQKPYSAAQLAERVKAAIGDAANRTLAG